MPVAGATANSGGTDLPVSDRSDNRRTRGDVLGRLNSYLKNLEHLPQHRLEDIRGPHLSTSHNSWHTRSALYLPGTPQLSFPESNQNGVVQCIGDVSQGVQEVLPMKYTTILF